MEISENIFKLELIGDQKMNCYVLHKNGHCLIIDPGYNKEVIQDYIDKSNFIVDGILLTHGHVDHVNAIDVYETNIYIHKLEIEMFNNNEINGYDLFNRKKEFDVDKINFIYVEDKDIIKFLDEDIEVIHTPGHTPGSVCYKYRNYIFSGDTLFKEKVGEWRFKKGSLDDLKKSILRLMNYSDEVVLLPGHFEISTIGEERIKNKFFIRVIKELNKKVG